MDHLNYESPAARLMAAEGLFEQDPFVLLDMGCSGGVDEIWRIFGDSLVVHGFDPRAEECERLQSAESNRNVHYHAGLVGLPEGHEFLRKKAAAAPAPCAYWEIVVGRSSYAQHAIRSAVPPMSPQVSETAISQVPGVAIFEPQSAPPAVPKIVLSDFVAQHLVNVDFLKVDTDGADLEVLLSAQPFFEALALLGAYVECQYQGEDDETSNTFHNIDRLMKRHGLMIFAMSTYAYSRGALPAPYLYRHSAQTTFGQPVFGDVAFMRDPLWPRVGRPVDLPLTKLLKLICLYEIFGVPDCAAELIQHNRSRIAEAIEPDRLLDLLTPPLGGRKVTYAEYTSAVTSNPDGLLDRASGFCDQALQCAVLYPVDGAVEPLNPLNPETIVEAGTPPRIVTPSKAWAYAVEIPISIPPHIPGRTYVRIQAQVCGGSCAFGLLDQRGIFQVRRIVAAGEQPATIFLEVADRALLKCVVIEKASNDDARVEIRLDDVSVQTDTQPPPRNLRDRIRSAISGN